MKLAILGRIGRVRFIAAVIVDDEPQAQAARPARRIDERRPRALPLAEG